MTKAHGSVIARRGLCLVLVAPSGAGKSSLARALLDAETGIALSVSVTTRAPRPGEIHGTHYHFIGAEDFTNMVEAGDLLEHATVFDAGYGTPAMPVRAALAVGQDMLFDIDWQGAQQLRAKLPGDVVQVAILPPSMAELERRLVSRGQDAPDRVASRMARARDEAAHARDAMHVIVNQDFDVALADLRACLRAARLARARLAGLDQFLNGLGA
jgi:guanylate kinase